MNSKILLTKHTSAIFLAIVLVTGTIALAFPSFMIGAQAEPYYEMDNRNASYEPDYSDRNNYEPTEYPSYKPEYPSENSYKFKDNKIVSINKLKCINNNLNINGNNTGDVNVGNKGQAYLGAKSYGGGYYDGYDNKQGKGFDDCIINNNNKNTNINIARGDGNQTIPPIPPVPPVEDECLLCFEETTQAVRDAINAFLAAQGDITVAPGIVIPADVNNFEQLCVWLTENAPLELTRTQINNLISQFLRANPTLDRGEVQELVECLIDADLIELTTCDDCFAALPDNVQAAVNSILETIPPGGLPQDTTPPLIIPTTVGSIPELCEFLENNIRSVTPEQRDSLISTFTDVPGSSQEIATALIDCLIDVGIFNLIQPE